LLPKWSSLSAKSTGISPVSRLLFNLSAKPLIPTKIREKGNFYLPARSSFGCPHHTFFVCISHRFRHNQQCLWFKIIFVAFFIPSLNLSDSARDTSLIGVVSLYFLRIDLFINMKLRIYVSNLSVFYFPIKILQKFKKPTYYTVLYLLFSKMKDMFNF
jgi:hypothetical protein